VGKPGAFRSLFASFCFSAQEIQNVFGCKFFQIIIAKFIAEFGKDRAVRPYRIFFVNLFCGNPARFCLLLMFSFCPPSLYVDDSPNMKQYTVLTGNFQWVRATSHII
jgi:hypothetical protein